MDSVAWETSGINLVDPEHSHPYCRVILRVILLCNWREVLAIPSSTQKWSFLSYYQDLTVHRRHLASPHGVSGIGYCLEYPVVRCRSLICDAVEGENDQRLETSLKLLWRLYYQIIMTYLALRGLDFEGVKLCPEWSALVFLLVYQCKQC